MPELGIKPSPFEINSFAEVIKTDDNPFLDNLVIDKKLVLKRFKTGEVVMPDEGQITNEESKRLTEENKNLNDVGLTVAKKQYKQRASFVLIYNNPMVNYKALSEASLKMLFFIFERKVGLGLDFIVLSVNECCTELNLSRPTITKGFVELIRNKLISKREDNVWWINPNYFYAGNRLKILSR